MKQSFFKNLLFIILLNLLIKPFWILGIDRTVQNLVGSAEYGLYFALMNFSLIFNIILDFGITNFNNRQVSRNPQYVQNLLSNLVGLKLLFGAIYFIISLLIAYFIGYRNQVEINLLAVILFNQFIHSFNIYFRSNISGLQNFKTDGIFSVLDRVLLIFICSILLWSNIFEINFSIKIFVLAQSAAYFLTSLSLISYIITKVKWIKIKFDWEYIRRILKSIFPFAILSLLMVIYYRVDGVMLERILSEGKHESGVYAQAFRLLDAFAMLPVLFAGILLPMLSKMIKIKEKVGDLVKFGFVLVFIPSSIIAITGFVYSHEIMDLLYWNHEIESSNVFKYLILGFIPISFTYIFGTLLTAGGYLKELNFISLAGLVINVILNLLFIPEFKGVGAAVSSLTTQILVVILQITVVTYKFQFKINKFFLLQLLLFILFLIVSIYFIGDLKLRWEFSILIYGALSILIAFFMRLLSLKEILKFFK